MTDHELETRRVVMTDEKYWSDDDHTERDMREQGGWWCAWSGMDGVKVGTVKLVFQRYVDESLRSYVYE